MLHITGSWVEFYKFLLFFTGKANYFTRPPPFSHTFSLIYRRFISPYILKRLRFYKHNTILSG